VANEIDTGGNAAETIAAEIVDRLLLPAAYGGTVILPLVAHRDMAGKNSLVSEHVKWPDLSSSVSARTDGSDLSNSDVNTTSVSCTVGSVGIMATVTDLFVAASVTSFADFATQMGYAVGQKIETDLAAEFADFASDVGATTVNLSWDNWLSALYSIENAALLDRGPIVAVMHPIQISDLRTAVADETGTPLTATDLANLYQLGASWEVAGVPIYSSTRCASVNTNADRRGAIFPAGNMAPLVYTRMWDPRAEFQRDASMVAYEIVVTAAYGDECIDTAGGFGILSDHE